MGIDLHWESEAGETKQMVADSDFHFSEILQAADLSSTACLRFIDRFGDTVFNQSQLPYLLAELEWLSEKSISLPAKHHLGKTLNLLSQAQGHTHTYIRFSGD